jgi:malonyl CoA-acyl carrier protein transacylase
MSVSRPAIAGLFPGQGSHTSDLRERAERILPELVERCIELVGEDPFPRVADSTRFAQPAIFCASLAGWYELGEHLQPVVLAGHSLGELTALVAAEALDPLSGLALAVRRGELMAEAGGEQEGMLALLGAEEVLIAELIRAHGVTLANDNAPGQVVLAGSLARLRAASLQAREAGARAIMLDVAGAFHSPAMAGAVAPFREVLDGIEVRRPRIAVVSGSRASQFEDVRAELAAAIVEPVRWRETMLALASLGSEAFVDFGPGEVLARLVARNIHDGVVLDAAELRAARQSRETSNAA